MFGGAGDGFGVGALRAREAGGQLDRGGGVVAGEVRRGPYSDFGRFWRSGVETVIRYRRAGRSRRRAGSWGRGRGEGLRDSGRGWHKTFLMRQHCSQGKRIPFVTRRAGGVWRAEQNRSGPQSIMSPAGTPGITKNAGKMPATQPVPHALFRAESKIPPPANRCSPILASAQTVLLSKVIAGPVWDADVWRMRQRWHCATGGCLSARGLVYCWAVRKLQGRSFWAEQEQCGLGVTEVSRDSR